MLSMVHNKAVSMSEKEWIVVGLSMFAGIVVVSLAMHTGYALAMRDLLVIREREQERERDRDRDHAIRNVPIEDREHDGA